jgi:uncharacterized protein (TIGR04168 family)
MIQIAIIGDVHRYFNQRDVTYFNQSAHHLLLFVGDLGNYRPGQGIAVARLMAQLTKPALMIPGNHDAVTPWQLLAEIKQWPRLIYLTSGRHEKRLAQLKEALGPVQLGGYGVHPFVLGKETVTVITARPQAMGGSDLSYAPYLARQFGIASLEQSAQRLKQCVDAAASDHLIFLAHNGPTGLGDHPHAIWGCDFRPQAGDFGDEDLRVAIEYAQQQGKQPLAVIAGHMHQRTKKGDIRPWHVERDGIHYLNAARVPRIFNRENQTLHYHLTLTLRDSSVHIEECCVPS